VTEPAIRPAAETDVPAIAELHMASYRAAYPGLVPEDILAGLDPGERERRWRGSLRDRTRTTFLAEGRPGGGAPLLGFAEIGRCRDADAGGRAGELMALHVRQECWGRGVGRALHGRALEALTARGFELATLWVLTGNARARRFYEAMGWSADGRVRRVVLKGAEVPETRYRIGLVG
jgi:ribosomal protein S18 acetylase RimI-like enzyme